MFRVVVLTLSDKGSKGERDDTSGPLIEEMIKQLPGQVIHYEIIPDEKDLIIEALKKSADQLRADLILTTGGTGVSPRDVTPDATLAVIDKEVPGFVEAMRPKASRKTPHAMISRPSWASGRKPDCQSSGKPERRQGKPECHSSCIAPCPVQAEGRPFGLRARISFAEQSRRYTGPANRALQ